MSKLLMDNFPLVVIPELACKIGLNEAIVLQQVHYWIENNKAKKKNFHNGRYWVYNSYKSWQETFPFWCERTIKTAFSRLERKGILISDNFNKSRLDKTKWYSIDYVTFECLCSSLRLGKSCPMECADFTQAIPETKKETNKKDIIDHSNGVIKSNIFDAVTKKYGHDRAEYMLSVVNWFIDDAYPEYTRRKHPNEGKAKRMVFAEKLLRCSDETVNDDNIVANALHRALQNYTNCDPTIYYITNPKVLGYWLIQDEEVGYEAVDCTEYAPVEAMY